MAKSGGEIGYASLLPAAQCFLRPQPILGQHLPSLLRRAMFEDGHIIFKKVLVSPALSHIYTETCMNASDNIITSLSLGVKPGNTEINVTYNSVEVKNYGYPIEVRIIKSAEDQDVYAPTEMISKIGSSSSYDDKKDRRKAGKNGTGAGAVNAVSVMMEVEVGDNFNRKHFYQKWTKPDYDPKLCGEDMNAEIVKKIARVFTNNPIVTNFKGNSFVRVKFIPAFERFAVTEFNEDYVSMFKADAHALAYCSEYPVIFNGEKIDYSVNTGEYLDMIGADGSNEYVLTSHEKVKVDDNWMVKKKVHSEWYVTHLPKGTGMFSFVNCTPTRSGGTHHDLLFSAITDEYCEILKDKIYPEDEVLRRKLIHKIVKKQLFCIKLSISKPDFDSQTKDLFTSELGVLKVPKEFLVDIGISSLITESYDSVLAADANKTIASRIKKRGLPKSLTDSDCARAKKFHPDNTLNITEGKSAKKYPDNGLRNNAHNGYLAVMGKILNICDLSIPTILKSESIMRFINSMGLQFGVDYSTEYARKSLRYNLIRICTDQDTDGFHIQVLFILLIHTYWPSLLEEELVTILASPLVRVINKSNGTKKAFFSMEEYELWRQDNQKGWTVEYCKGLGSHDPEDIASDFANGVNETIVLIDKNAKKNLKIAFSREMTDVRKKLLLKTGYPSEIRSMKKATISELIFTRWRIFSLYNVSRSIPSFADGLKSGERKILYTIFNHYKGEKDLSDETKTKKIGINSLGGKVIETAEYHHGEVSLYETSTKLARGYPGSSNLPLFYPKGDFGSRQENGKDHSQARYIKTCPRALLRYIFRPEDIPILPELKDSDTGKYFEPEFYLPIIPLQLVSNVKGMGTGWSSTIPPHDVDEVIVALSSVICGEEPEILTPKYRFYQGQIISHLNGLEGTNKAIKEIRNEQIKHEDGEVEYIESEVIMSTTSKPHIDVRGVYTVRKEDGRLIFDIEDAPPGISYDTIYAHYDKLVEQRVIEPYKRGVGYFRFKCQITFTREGTTIAEEKYEQDDLEEELYLREKVTLNNMYTIDPLTKMPAKHESANDIIKDFVKFRLPWYDVRKKQMVESLTAKTEQLRNQIKMVKMLHAGEMSLHNGRIAKEDKEVRSILTEAGIDYSLVSLSTTSHSESALRKDVAALEKAEEEIAAVMKVSGKSMYLKDLKDLQTEHRRYYSRVTIDEKMDDIITKSRIEREKKKKSKVSKQE